MEIREGNRHVVIAVVDRGPSDLPSAGDLELLIEASSGGGCGHGFAWVTGSSVASFIRQFEELEKYRKGEASLEGMSPGEMQLRIWAVNPRGHMAVEGRVTRCEFLDDRTAFRHAIEFGFEFDPTLLPKILSAIQNMADS